MKQLLKIIFGFLTVIFIIFICFIIFIINPFAQIKHNANLRKFAKEFISIPLPNKSKQIGDNYMDFGLLGGNSNHCDYYVSKLIFSDLTQKELDSYYRQFTLAPADPNGFLMGGGRKRFQRGEERLSVVAGQPWKYNVYPSYNEKEAWEKIASDHKVESKTNSGGIILISASDDYYFPDDLRCH